MALEHPRSAADYAATLEAMRSETERLSAMVDDLLLIARADAAQLPIVRAPADLMEIVDESCRALKPLLSGRELTLNWNVGDELPIAGDVRLLRRAISNLLTNAIKFAPAGSGVISAAVSLDGDFGRVEIADNGRGIAEEDLPHIFERFYRGARCDGSESEGAGLGLAIVKMIAELHGGRVVARQNAGTGTILTLWIPAAPDRSGDENQPYSGNVSETDGEILRKSGLEP